MGQLPVISATTKDSDSDSPSLKVRSDLLHVLYAGMLLNCTTEQIKLFWTHNPLPGYRSEDLKMILNELWQNRTWYSQKFLFSLLNNFERFLVSIGKNILDFNENSICKINKGMLIQPRDWLSWSKPVIQEFFTEMDTRFLALKLLDHYNSHIIEELHYSIVYHSSENEWNRTVLMFHQSLDSCCGASSQVPSFDCEIWVVSLIKKIPAGVNLPVFESYFMLADRRSIPDIIPGTIENEKYFFYNDKIIAEQITFSSHCAQHKLEMPVLMKSDYPVWLIKEDVYCPDRKRNVLHKGCVYDAPVYLFGFDYKKIKRPDNFLDQLIDDISGFNDNTWGEIKKIHYDLQRDLSEKVVFKYDRKNETFYMNGEYLVKNVPAKILRKVLTGYIGENRIIFNYTEFIKDESIISNPKNPNFVVRLQRLMSILQDSNSKVSIQKKEKGCFEFSADCRVEYTEFN